jgi:hypothetical protein
MTSRGAGLELAGLRLPLIAELAGFGVNPAGLVFLSLDLALARGEHFMALGELAVLPGPVLSEQPVMMRPPLGQFSVEFGEPLVGMGRRAKAFPSTPLM